MSDYIEKKKRNHFKRLENTMDTTLNLIYDLNKNLENLIEMNEKLIETSNAYIIWKNKLSKE